MPEIETDRTMYTGRKMQSKEVRVNPPYQPAFRPGPSRLVQVSPLAEASSAALTLMFQRTLFALGIKSGAGGAPERQTDSLARARPKAVCEAPNSII